VVGVVEGCFRIKAVRAIEPGGDGERFGGEGAKGAIAVGGQGRGAVEGDDAALEVV